MGHCNFCMCSMGRLWSCGCWIVSVLSTVLSICAGVCPTSGQQHAHRGPPDLLFIIATSLLCHSKHFGRSVRGLAPLKRFYQIALCGIASMVAYNEIWPQICFYADIAANHIQPVVAFIHAKTNWAPFEELSGLSKDFWSGSVKFWTGVGLLQVAALEVLATISQKDIRLNYALGCGRKEVVFSEENSYHTIPPTGRPKNIECYKKNVGPLLKLLTPIGQIIYKMEKNYL